MAGADRSVSPFDRARAWIVWKQEKRNRTPRRAWNLLATPDSGRWFSSQTPLRPVNGKTQFVARSRCWPIPDSVANDRGVGGVRRRRNGRVGILWFQDRSLTVAARKATVAARKSPTHPVSSRLYQPQTE